MPCFRLKSLSNYRMGAAGLPSNVLFLSSAVLYVLFLSLSLHLRDLNTSLELLLFICSKQYDKYEEIEEWEGEGICGKRDFQARRMVYSFMQWLI